MSAIGSEYLLSPTLNDGVFADFVVIRAADGVIGAHLFGVNYFSRRVDSSLLLPGAACCLIKDVTHPSGRDGQQIEEATECGDKA